MSYYYPVYLNIKDRKCIVVGGGVVAERKINLLLKKGANITIISPDLTDNLHSLAEENKITHIKDKFHERYLEKAQLIIGATNDNRVNKEIYNAAKKRNILVNIVDSPKYCNFIVPSVVERGDLIISISTSGRSPALSKKIRKELEQKYGEEYSQFLSIMGRIREELLLKVKDQKKREKIFDNLVNSDIIDLIKQGKEEKINSLIDNLIEKINHQKE